MLGQSLRSLVIQGGREASKTAEARKGPFLCASFFATFSFKKKKEEVNMIIGCEKKN